MQVNLGKPMHVYTHMGALQIRGMSGVGEVGSSFPAAQVDALLVVAAQIACYAATAVAWLKKDTELEAEIEQQFITFNHRIKQFGGVDIPMQ